MQVESAYGADGGDIGMDGGDRGKIAMRKPSFAAAGRTALATATLVTTALAALAGTATAADLGRRPAPYTPAPPPPPLYSWSSCYIGANIGGGWASKSANDVSGFVTGVVGADLGTHTASGVIGGGQIGCDYQAGIWVFGVQGMFDASGMQGSNTQPLGFAVNNTNIPWLTTVTGRVGVTAAPTVLVYAKGGGAWVRDNFSLTALPGGATIANANNTPSGWTVGGGLEWAFAGNWSAFAEYNYLDFGTPGVTFTPTAGGPTFPINIKQTINSFMVGINYRFNAAGYY
jgi:outer membrane immunogenic protein